MSPYVRTRSLGTAATLCLLVTGCALQQLESLEAARLAYTEAAKDPALAASAPVALYEAKQALTRAETAWEQDEDEVETTHLAYIALRRVEIARAVASEKQAEIEAGTLGERRANSVRQYLVSLGTNGNRLAVISYGEERPEALGSDEASWARNRRAVFVIN